MGSDQESPGVTVVSNGSEWRRKSVLSSLISVGEGANDFGRAQGVVGIAIVAVVDIVVAVAATNRLNWLLLFSALSYAAFIALTQQGTDLLPGWLNEQNLPLVIFAWCAGVGNLMMIQTWSWGSTISLRTCGSY